LNSIKGSSDDDISIAESIRSTSSTYSIHSQKSLKILVEKAKERIEKLKQIPEMDLNIAPPILVTHTDDDGARLAETKSLNKLPFKNRNPSI